MQTWLKDLRAIGRRFLPQTNGNVAINFAISIIPLMGAIGAAVDYSQANSVKAAMQAALDSTVLMLSRDGTTLTNAQLQTKAHDYFTALFTRPGTQNIAVGVSYTSVGGSTMTVNASADVPTAFMSAAGVDTITVRGESVAKWGSKRLRVALVLDNTGSMAQNDKIGALKNATKSLLAQLKSSANVNGDVYVSIIPFSKDVNANPVTYQQSWIDWTLWEAANGTCSNTTYKSKSSCTSHGNVWSPSSRSTWNGCITDRGDNGGPSAANYDQTVAAPDPNITASKYPAEQYNNCPSAMSELSFDWMMMNNVVDDMTPAGSTNQPIGLVWGWLSLVGGGPLVVPIKEINHTYQEIIILLSDGLNTADRWYGSQSSVDKRMYNALSGGTGTCANIKAAGITIYTIQVNTGGDPTSTLLSNCASGADKFFLLTSADQIVSTFNQIGTALSKLRVAQ